MSRDYKRKEFEVDQKSDEVLFEEEQAEPKTRNGIIVNAPNVNVRDEASSAGKVVATVQEGTKIFMMEEKGNFVRVRIVYEDRPTVDGYVHSDFCKEVQA